MLPADSAAPLADRIRAVADEVAASLDAFVVAVDLKGRSGQHIVEVFADTDDGIGVDDLARLSREIGFALDEVMPDKYLLNVSSPGATKPLALPRQYARHIGRRLRVEMRAAGGSEAAAPATRRVEGTLGEVSAGTFTLVPDPPEVSAPRAKGARPPAPSPDAVTEPLAVAFDDVVEARVLLPW